MYKIGEFSKLLNTTTKTIRYYDNEGLLLPDYIDSSTGYRFYSYTKIAEYNRIVTLKELGFSLVEIKDLIYEESDASIIKMMQSRKEAILLELEQVNNRLALIQEMEDDFMKLVDVYEDQAQYKNKIKIEGQELVFEYPDVKPIAINYVCPNKSDLYFTTNLYLELINHFGLVNCEYEAIKKIFSAGENAYIFKCTEETLNTFVDKEAKTVSFAFSMGSKVDLVQLNEILIKFEEELGQEIPAYFSANLDDTLGEREVEISLINIK